MEVRTIGFIPPIIGTKSHFNTFRLSGFYSKRLKEGEEVFLLDEKEKVVFGKARVVSVEVGKLAEMCVIHGDKNHTELNNDSFSAPERLYKLLQKIYGPHIAIPGKKTTVIYLQRIE